jgi:hypothetical protein
VRPNWLSEKKVTLLMQGALKNEPELGDLPSALDFVKNDADRMVMQLHFTQKLAARPIIAPPDMPADRAATLRAAFAALGRDPEFLADAEKSKQEVAFVPGEEVEKVVSLIVSTPPDIADRYAKAFALTQVLFRRRATIENVKCRAPLYRRPQGPPGFRRSPART